MLKSALAVLFIAGFLTACDSTASLKQLRTASPTSDTYSAALAADYKEFAESKVASYDWWTSKYFADKGLMAAYGRDIDPELPANWDIPDALRPEFEDARTKLFAAVSANKATQPELAASAVVAYDRWLEVQSNQWDTAAITERRAIFFAILAKLSEAHLDTTATTTPLTSAEGNTITPIPPAALTPPAVVESTSTVLYFPLDSDRLGDNANAALAQLVTYVRTAGKVTISINGHADRAGTEEYNLSLSERRARFVMQALEKAGVPANLMKYFAFGETDPAVPTADGVPEPKNRRVEIFIE